MGVSEKSFRIDLVFGNKIYDEKNKIFYAIVYPDPRRYKWVTRKGEKLLFDKFDNIYIPEKLCNKMIEDIKNLPLYDQQQTLGNSDEYVKSRLNEIENNMRNLKIQETFEDKSNEFLESLKKDKLNFVIISLDIVKSTLLSTNMDLDKYVKIISIILFELSEVVPHFQGHVLKYTGDGLIAYFPAPSFISKHDLAIDCAFTLKNLVYHGINNILCKLSLRKIDLRIGLDSGKAIIQTIGSPKTKQHKDIIGSVVSLAAKIQSIGKPGEILIGETVNRNLHTMWRQYSTKLKNIKNWKYSKVNGEIYKVYKIEIPK